MKQALIVDDTKNIRILLSKCLEIQGYKVKVAAGGQEALNLIKNEKFDIIFLDIKMPEISGTKVLKKIRSINIDIPIVIMTAFATIKNAVECTKLGAAAYLQKPFTIERVKCLLDEMESKKSGIQDMDYNINTAKKLIEDGKTDDAYKILKKSLAINPSCPEIYWLIGKINEMNNNMNEAGKFYKTAELFKKD